MYEMINPPHLKTPRGYSHGVKCKGTMLFLSGATGGDEQGGFPSSRGDIVKQFEDSLTYMREIVTAAGGTMQDIVKLTYFVRDRDAYVANLRPLGEIYRRFFGKHFCAQSLFGVTALFEDDALIEIEAIACIGD